MAREPSGRGRCHRGPKKHLAQLQGATVREHALWRRPRRELQVPEGDAELDLSRTGSQLEMVVTLHRFRSSHESEPRLRQRTFAG